MSENNEDLSKGIIYLAILLAISTFFILTGFGINTTLAVGIALFSFVIWMILLAIIPK